MSMLSIIQTHAGEGIRIKESCGLRHELQVVTVARPGSWSAPFSALKDLMTGRMFPVQVSRTDPSRFHVMLEVEPFQELHWIPEPGVLPALAESCKVAERTGVYCISNGKVELEVESDRDRILHSSFPAGPIRRFRRERYPWRGGCYLEGAGKPLSFECGVLETGPLRSVLKWRLDFEHSGFYEVLITLDAGQTFVRLEERFACGTHSQLVWDFANEDLPVRVRLLDHTEGYRPVIPNLHMDNRLARLAAWTQGSQLFDLSDGFGLCFKAGDEAGFVSLEGGAWTGAQLNHMELWMRRQWPADPATRRGLPPETKADSNPSPEAIRARGDSICGPHVTVEGWLRGGSRRFALVMTGRREWGYDPEAAMRALPDPFNRRLSPGSSAFMCQFKELAGSPGQYHLRKLHTQRGLMALQPLLEMSFEWPEVAGRKPAFGWPHPSIAGHHGADCLGNDRAEADAMLDYLKTRVLAFWNVSGAGATNPVSGRRIAGELFRFEYLQDRAVLTSEEWRYGRALLAFLVYLYSSDNFYPANPPMQSMSDPDSFEPTLGGLSNQNFYTDAINGAGIAAQIFPGHPMAENWRALFGRMFRRQLDYHVFPESGVWEESHTYYHHVLLTVLPTLLRRRADGVDDFFADPVFQKLAGYAIKLVTPPDVMFGGHRHIAPLGDHAPEGSPPWRYRSLYEQLAGCFSSCAPLLAGNLAWLCRECGAKIPAGIPVVAPPWNNEYIQGLGYFFRGRATGEDDELFILRCGAAWGHHHHDDGSLQFYARGRAWITDAACGNATKRGSDKFEASGHSRWAPKGFRPLNSLWRFNRGWIEAHGHSPTQGEWARAYAPVAMALQDCGNVLPLRSLIEHWRTVTKWAPGLYLVVDHMTLPEESVVRYHVPCEGVEFSRHGNRVTCQAGELALDISVLPWEEVAASFWLATPSDPESSRFATQCLEFNIGTGCLVVTALYLRPASARPLSLFKVDGGARIEAQGRYWDVDPAIPGSGDQPV